MPKIFEKETATDTWVATEYAVRLRKRGYVMLLVSQHPKNIEDDIRDNVHVNFLFRMQSDQNAKIVAGALGYSHYARVDHIGRILANLKFRQAIVKIPEIASPFVIDSAEFRLNTISESALEAFMPKVRLSASDLEEEFLENIERHPFITVVERRSILGWDESKYSEVVSKLIGKGVVERQEARLGKGRPRVLYQLAGQKPSIRHEFYVNWIIEQLAKKGIECTASKVGPDIQIPSRNVAINVELGSSNIHGNIPKALRDFAVVIVCSDDKTVLDAVSSGTESENVLCAQVQDVPALFR